MAKDLEWFKEQGHAIPEPLSPGLDYSLYIEELSKNDPQAFICHFYNTYFAHTAGGRMIGRKVRLRLYMKYYTYEFYLQKVSFTFIYMQVAAKILNGKELEFYKWDGDLTLLLQDVREKLNRVAQVISKSNRITF